MANPDFARLVRSLMDKEVTPTLAAHGVKDVTDYKLQLLERFKNPALRHRTSQIAMDGSQKYCHSDCLARSGNAWSRAPR